ncbi:MAG: 16S rRNA (guanine(527)-N(7))-methyltransferase RsmG [Magnetococcales bacterium]|nr:16S rRNA (guanine(527)-N(7))-methyltransferase RsmG [Magnetococcales bacterium]
MERFPHHRFDPETCRRLDLYAGELLQWSKTYNLIGPCTRETLYDRHFRDGALLLEHLHATKYLADIGSGAGLPGMVVALLAQGIEHLRLIEPRKKRIRFLNHVIALIGLKNVATFHGTAGQAARVIPMEFDTVISRGLGDLILGANEALPLLAPGGTYLTFKGKNHALEQEKFLQDQISASYEPPKILYEEVMTGNRIIALTRKKGKCP